MRKHPMTFTQNRPVALPAPFLHTGYDEDFGDLKQEPVVRVGMLRFYRINFFRAGNHLISLSRDKEAANLIELVPNAAGWIPLVALNLRRTWAKGSDTGGVSDYKGRLLEETWQSIYWALLATD